MFETFSQQFRQDFAKVGGGLVKSRTPAMTLLLEKIKNQNSQICHKSMSLQNCSNTKMHKFCDGQPCAGLSSGFHPFLRHIGRDALTPDSATPPRYRPPPVPQSAETPLPPPNSNPSLAASNVPNAQAKPPPRDRPSLTAGFRPPPLCSAPPPGHI